MSLAGDFLTAAIQIGEGSFKEGFTVGGVSYQYDQANDTITGTFTVPVTVVVSPQNGSVTYVAKDAFNPPASN